jgi:hypothetical protein
MPCIYHNNLGSARIFLLAPNCEIIQQNNDEKANQFKFEISLTGYLHFFDS